MGPQPPGAMLSWAQQMFNFPDGSGAAPVPGEPRSHRAAACRTGYSDITGSVTTDAGGRRQAKRRKRRTPRAGKDGKPAALPAGTVIPTDGAALPTGAERAILERLQERRQELDTRARELDIRESLIQGAEKRMDARLAELKDIESRIKVETASEGRRRSRALQGPRHHVREHEAARRRKNLQSVSIPMCCSQVASQINPRQMAEILAQMSPDVAERLTVDLASKAQQAKQSGPADLPKIQGQPTAR